MDAWIVLAVICIALAGGLLLSLIGRGEDDRDEREDEDWD